MASSEPAVYVHGPATTTLVNALWAAGLRPVSGGQGPTLWLPTRPRRGDGRS